MQTSRSSSKAQVSTEVSPQSMNSSKLAALECLRGFAAIYVVAGHICNLYFMNPWWSLPFRFAGEAVILFFLLSGFVIRYSTKDTVGTSEYLFKRVRRIYPLFALSLLLSYLLASLPTREWAPVNPWQLAGNLVMLQDFGFARPGVWVDQFYNQALWSLSYEFWFYIFFIVIIRTLRGMDQQSLAVAAIAVVGVGVQFLWPNQISFFATHLSIWWSGVRIAHEYRTFATVSLRRQGIWAGFMLFMAALWAIPLLNIPRSEWSFGLYPIMEMRRFAFAGIFIPAAITFANQLWNRGGRSVFRWTLGPFGTLAPISYGIYAFHFPILVVLLTISAIHSPILYCVAALASIVVVAYLCEVVLQVRINRATDPLLKRLQRRARVAQASPMAAREGLDEGSKPGRVPDTATATMIEVKVALPEGEGAMALTPLGRNID